MAKRGLTGNEKRVLYGLVHHPTNNDRELSELLSVKVSTVTAIRRRLRRGEYFVTRRLPMMHRLGWEILAAGHVPIDPAASPQGTARLREALKDRVPDLFHVSASSDHLAFLAAAPNYTALARDVADLRLLLEKARVLGAQDVRTVVFPMALSVVPAFFDYSHVLAQGFGIEDRIAVRLDPPRPATADLTRKEAEVLKGLVRFPELSDKALAGKVKVSRQAVSKMRREFEGDDLLRTVRLPNLRALGFELYGTGFAHFAPSATVRARADAIEKILRMSPTFFLISSDADSVVMGAARNYEHFSTLRSALVRYHEERGFFRGDPSIYVTLTGATDLLRHCEFGGLVGGLTDRGARAGG